MAIIIGDRDRSLRSRQAVEHPRVTLHVLPGAYHAFDQERITTMRSDGRGNEMPYGGSATLEAERIAKSFVAKHLKR